jgi:TonB family protein
MDPGQNRRDGEERPSPWGYLLAILASALGHVALVVLLLIVIPRLFQRTAPPPVYTVKIVDSIPAGDLGSHLPRLSRQEPPKPKPPEPSIAEAETPAPVFTPPPENPDRNAIALNTLHQSVTPTPTPPPEPTVTPTSTPPPEPTETPTLTPEPTETLTPTPPPEPTPTATPRPKKHHPKPVTVPVRTPTATPTPTRTGHRHAKPSPSPKHSKPSPTPEIAVAAAEPTPGIKQRLNKVRQQLLAEHLKELAAEESRKEAEDNGTSAESSGGPVSANEASEGKGYGIGPGAGSMGIQQDAGFLLYYQQVQKKIRAAWSFAGDNPELTATVTFGINPDGSLNSIHVTASSNDPSFDDSVVRAIRRAAPFPPAPEKYRAQFSDGLPAIFKLGELQGGGSG